MSRVKLSLYLSALSGVMLGLSFPPIPVGVMAAFAFVPLFIAFESIESYGEAFRHAFITFLIFNIITLYWAGGFTHGKDWYMMIAGGLLLLAHPFFFFVPILAWMVFRRQYGFKLSLVVFPFFWVAFEYLHSLFEIGFPWLTLGNTQTYDLTVVQIVSLTGVYGLSFWVLIINVLAYFLYAKIAVKDWQWFSIRSIAAAVVIILVYFLPKLYGNHILKNISSQNDSKVRIGIIQPNIDPFEKWQGSAEKQLDILQQLTDSIAKERVDLVLWPETAVPFYVLHPANTFYYNSIKRQVDRLGINLLTGIPDIVYYQSNENAPKSSKVLPDGQRYDTFNSSMLLQPHTTEIQKYAKIVLVPFAERVPFSEALSFLNAMQWNFGLGGWGVGRDTTVFHFKTQDGRKVRFSNMICYESVYPSFVSAFVRKGAEFLTVITNDSWWGNTSGVYQHERVAVLRAVENRRWVAQCANGGISCFVDPYGRIVQRTGMFEQTELAGEVEPRSDLTFYSARGDWFPEMCVIGGLFYTAAALGRIFYTRIRKQQESDVTI